jgi:predicted esterase
MTSLLRTVLSLSVFTAACTEMTDPEPVPDDPGEVTQAVTTTAFTATYTGQGNGASTCNATFNITGQEPSTAGTFPVFVYTIGTSEAFTNASATAAVAAMASRGFVAATVAYNSGSFSGCSTISGKARCIFNSASSTSAISRLCARAKADCSKGVVVGGFSQGAVIATLAKNFDARVAAAWGMGDGVTYSIFNLTSCMANGNRTLPSSRLRVVDGEKDQFIGPTATRARSQLLSLTGLSCGSSAFNCLQSNGSGWFIIQNAQVGDGSADHCYMRRTGDCGGSQNSLDAGWQTGADPWELNANLDWLKTFTLP